MPPEATLSLDHRLICRGPHLTASLLRLVWSDWIVSRDVEAAGHESPPCHILCLSAATPVWR